MAANLQVTASQADLLRGRQRERAEIELGLRARELEIAALFATGKINEQQAQELQRNAQLLRELQLDELIVDFQRASDAAEDFGAGVREGLREAIESFDTLREQGRFVGSALIDSLGFSITSTFDQIAEGSIKAKDFFSAFAESMLRDIGRIIAQLFAMRLAQSLVGFFAPTPSGDGGGGGPFSSIARAFASGGAAPENLGVTPTTTGRSAQPITVNINLGEGADGSEVVRQLPRIKEAITAGLRGGDRNLILAVRGAVS